MKIPYHGLRGEKMEKGMVDTDLDIIDDLMFIAMEKHKANLSFNSLKSSMVKLLLSSLPRRGIKTGEAFGGSCD